MSYHLSQLLCRDVTVPVPVKDLERLFDVITWFVQVWPLTHNFYCLPFCKKIISLISMTPIVDRNGPLCNYVLVLDLPQGLFEQTWSPLAKKVSVALPGFILLHLFGHHHQKLVKLNCPIPVLIHLIDHISEFSLCRVLNDKVGSPTCSISIPTFFLKGSPLSIFCLYWFFEAHFSLALFGDKEN